ncbi:hypothetical protein [Paenibacillus xanthanilyticus]|uniref:Uncharacterized protein n=1 Tax=Paenibacillus xanthanilyticus TaxID=1783531 RepID=A0ABV8K2U0_9BACL
MPNMVPYLILASLAISLLSYILISSKRWMNVVLFLAFIGMIYLFEYTILVLFDCYVYYPKILPNPYLDSMMGALISNFLTVPVLGLAMVVYRLSFRWNLVFTLLLCGVEWLFLHLGIYAHHWWKLGYTLAAFLFFFWFVRYWANRLSRGRRLFQYVTLLMFSLSTVDTMSYLFMLTGVRQFLPGVFELHSRDDVFFTFPYTLVKAALIANAVFWSPRLRWLFAALFIIMLLQYPLIRTGVLHIYIPLWLYYLIYVPCCLFAAWCIRRGMRVFRDQDASTA